MTYDEYQNSVQLLHKTLAEFSNKLEKVYAPLNSYQNALSILIDSIERIKEPYTKVINESNNIYENMIAPCSKIGMELCQQLADNFSSINYSNLAQSIMDIEVCDDFVIVPEALIPDTFQCEEVTQDSKKQKSTVKHLSYANTLAFLAIIIPLICWRITCIREDISSQ